MREKFPVLSLASFFKQKINELLIKIIVRQKLIFLLFRMVLNLINRGTEDISDSAEINKDLKIKFEDSEIDWETHPEVEYGDDDKNQLQYYKVSFLLDS